MLADSALENCTDQDSACLQSEHDASHCQDCDGTGSAGVLPCGRCSGNGIEPTSANAAEVREGIRSDYGALWNWRSREWLLSGLPLQFRRRGESN